MTPAVVSTLPGSSPVRAPALPVPSVAGLVPRECALPPLPPRRFELRCADVHLVRCEHAASASRLQDSIASMRAHGATVHGFTPVWYSQERLAAMARAVRER